MHGSWQDNDDGVAAGARWFTYSENFHIQNSRLPAASPIQIQPRKIDIRAIRYGQGERVGPDPDQGRGPVQRALCESSLSSYREETGGENLPKCFAGLPRIQLSRHRHPGGRRSPQRTEGRR
jgi:hypothetical protein